MAGLTIVPLPAEVTSISWMPICIESKVVFNWSIPIPNCHALLYSITSSNCGSCPTTSTDTNVTCTDVPMNGSVCRLHVQAVFCEGVNANTPDSVPWQLVINPQCESKFQTVYSLMINLWLQV